MTATQRILVTGAVGSIGCHSVLDSLAPSGHGSPVAALDKLSYVNNLGNLASLQGDADPRFIPGDIGDRILLNRLLAEQR
jgi:dTDP-glucose 4,6-dehydratase